MKREQIRKIVEAYRYDTTESEYSKLTDQACENMTNAILAIPLDIPSEEEIKNRYGKSPSNHIHGDRFAEEGAKWAINEIIERNK
jgi:hypothetical protein